jgi:hypothetical protein
LKKQKKIDKGIKEFRPQQFKELPAAKHIQHTPSTAHRPNMHLTKHDKQSKHIVYITKQN